MPVKLWTIKGQVSYNVEQQIRELVNAVNALGQQPVGGAQPDTAAGVAAGTTILQQPNLFQTVTPGIALAGRGTPTQPLDVQVDGTTVTVVDNKLTATGGGGSGITELTGDVTAGPGSGSQAATLANSGVAAATYGDATHVAQVAVDAKGRVTTAANVAITAGVSTTGSPASGNLAKFSGASSITNGDLTGDVTTSGGTVVTLANSGASAGTYGDSNNVAQIAVDAKGRITSVANVAIIGASTVDYSMLFRPGVFAYDSAANGGNFTTGCQFVVNRNLNITGAEIFVPASLAGKNLKVQLWTDAGVSLKNVTLTSIATGSNVATFSTPYAATSGVTYRVSMWIDDGSNYMRAGSIPRIAATVAAAYLSVSLFAGGDAFPNTSALGEQYPINPTFS